MDRSLQRSWDVRWKSRHFAAATVTLLFVIGGVGTIRAVDPMSAVEATLDGAPADPREMRRNHCHDAVEGVLTCYRTSSERDASLDRSLGYVRLYVDENYGGGSLTLTQPVSNLGVYAFNDATTSFKSLNDGHPKFWADVDYDIGNGAWQWATGAWVANVGSGANDRFSSVKNVP